MDRFSGSLLIRLIHRLYSEVILDEKYTSFNADKTIFIKYFYFQKQSFYSISDNIRKIKDVIYDHDFFLSFFFISKCRHCHLVFLYLHFLRIYFILQFIICLTIPFISKSIFYYYRTYFVSS